MAERIRITKRIILKRILLVCVAIQFVGIKCDQMLLQNSRDGLMLRRTIGCAAKCLGNSTENILEACYDHCSENQIVPLIPMIESKSNETFQLICRDADAIVIEVNSNNKLESINTNFPRELYVVIFQESDKHFASKLIYVSNSAHVKIENLTVNTSYHVTVSIVNAKEEYRHLPNTLVVRTLPSNTYRPKTISNENITLSNFTINKAPDYLSAYVHWAPADDMVCHYRMVLYETMENTANQHAFQAFKISDSQKLYRFEVTNLVFDSQYHLAINGINTKDEALEGMESAITFATPTCWEVHGLNTSLCPPQPLQHLTSIHSLEAEGVYSINVTWEPIQPEHQPIYYIVSIWPHYSGLHVPDDAAQSFDTASLNVTGDKNYAYFHKIMLNSMDYTIQVEAVSNGGTILTHAQQSLKDIYTNYLDQDRESSRIIYSIVIVAPILCLVFYCRWRRDKKNQSGNRNELVVKFRKENKANDMEVKPSQIVLYEPLGEGHFGIVYKAMLMPQRMDVAVKMVKADHDGNIKIIEEFFSEITLTKSVGGQHKNILNIVGHCTTGNVLMLVTEYCSGGNLRDYLRAFRRQPPENSDWQLGEVVDGLSQMLLVENRGYDVLMPHEFHSEPNEQLKHNNSENVAKSTAVERLTGADLLDFAIQIASGMEFLANNKIVHRDLAARNILVCADGTIRIADFGLSRNIYVDNGNIYTKRSGGRVPLKWLALESLVRQQYTIHSDVWSYGILLYEIVTLGGDPYPDLKEDLKTYLGRGERMSKPNNCGPELYEIMLECWNTESEERPSFGVLVKRLEILYNLCPNPSILSISVEG